MNLLTRQYLIRWTCLTASVTLLTGLVGIRPAIAEQPPALNTKAPSTQAADPETLDPQTVEALANFRATYDSMMSTFDLLLAQQGDILGQGRVAAGREGLKALTDKNLARAFRHTSIPDLSGLSVVLDHVMAKHAPHQSKVIPTIAPLPGGCTGVASDGDTLYALLIIKEVANSVLAAAAWVCNEDILGENGSLGCVPVAIAADVANGLFDTAAFCAGMATANETDAIYGGLSDIESTDAANTSSIINNDNANKASIILNANANTTTLVNQANANTTTIENNDNANTASIINNANANTTAIINNANANKTEIENLILRTQIEQSLTVMDNGAQVAMFELPNAHGGYLDLVATIVTQTLANILASGGSVGNAQPFLTTANAAKAAGNFKLAYFNYRQAYQAAGH